MKADIHPAYNEIKAICSCGHEFMTSSTLGNDTIHLDVCSNCHPFYTGKQKLMDTEGRVDKFMNKYRRGGKKSTGTSEKAGDQAS